MGSGERVSRPGRAREPARQGRDGSLQAAPGGQVRGGRAWSSATALLLNRRLPGARPSRPPRGVLLRGPRPLTCPVAAAPPPSSISQPGPQRRQPPGTRPGSRHHRHRRRRLRASREPPSRGRRGAVTETPRAPPPPPDTQAPAPACPPRPQRLAGPRVPGAGRCRRPALRPPRRAAARAGLAVPRCGDLGSEAGESWRAELEGACGLSRRPGTRPPPPPPWP